MRCADYVDTLTGRVPWTVRLHAAAHARRCPSCRALGRAQRALVAALGDLPRPAPPPDLHARLLAVAADAPPARRPRALRGLALAAALAAAAALLLLPRSRNRDALAQAIEDLRQAKTVHLVWSLTDPPTGPGGSPRHQQYELWLAGPDRYRRELIESRGDGPGREVLVRNGDRRWYYRGTEKTVEITEGVPGSDVSKLDECLESPRQWLLDRLGSTQGKGRGPLLCKRTFDGSKGEPPRPVVEYQYTADDGAIVTAVVDGKTGRLLRLSVRMTVGNRGYDVVRLGPIEYDIPIPDERFTFTPPPGTRVIVRDWWKTRRSQVLAEAAAGDWKLTLHSVDLRDNGEIIVSVSREPLFKGAYNAGAPPKGRLLDDSGQAYAQSPKLGVDHGHWTLFFVPAEPAASPPRNVTVELDPYPPGSEAGLPPRPDPGVVTFNSVPVTVLPPGDPFAARRRSAGGTD